jgi:hypothetical protein
MPEFIDPVLAKTSPKRSFSVFENARFGLVFAKTGSINSGTEQFQRFKRIHNERASSDPIQWQAHPGTSARNLNNFLESKTSM